MQKGNEVSNQLKTRSN